MSIKSKIAAIAAASIGMVLTQSSSPRAETEDNSAPEKVTKIAAHLDEEILYSALSDDVLEKAATVRHGGNVRFVPLTSDLRLDAPQQSLLRYSMRPAAAYAI